jgi:hypothetical protein
MSLLAHMVSSACSASKGTSVSRWFFVQLDLFRIQSGSGVKSVLDPIAHPDFPNAALGFIRRNRIWIAS